MICPKCGHMFTMRSGRWYCINPDCDYYSCFSTVTIIPACNGTGEVEDKPEILPLGHPDKCSDCGHDLNKSAGENCNVRHEDKPEMPERIWAWKYSDEYYLCTCDLGDEVIGYLRADLAVEKDNQIDNLKMLLEEANKQIMALKERDRQNTEMVASMTDQLDKSVEREKVRELVESLDKLRYYAWDCIDGCCKKQEQHFIDLNCDVESVIISLFPEGLGGEG